LGDPWRPAALAGGGGASC
jgi:4'-phosphopantetheinyl transferase EntD